MGRDLTGRADCVAKRVGDIDVKALELTVCRKEIEQRLVAFGRDANALRLSADAR